MKCLIRFLLAVLPTALFADTWLEGGSASGGSGQVIVQNSVGVTNDLGVVVTNDLSVTITNEPVNIVVTNEISVVITNIQQGGGTAAGDNLGDHTATSALEMADFAINNASAITIKPTGAGPFTIGSIYGGPGAYNMPYFTGGYPNDSVGFWPWNAANGAVMVYDEGLDTWVPKMITPFEQVTLVSGATFKQEGNIAVINAAPQSFEWPGTLGVEIRGGVDASGDGGWVSLKPGIQIPAADPGYVQLANENGQGIIRVESTGQVKTFNQSNLVFDNAATAQITVLVPGEFGPTPMLMNFVNGLFTGMTTPP